MPRAEDDFELVLRRCHERLSAITLTVPGLDVPGARRPPSVSLDTLTLDAPADFRPLAAPNPPVPAPARPPLPRIEPPVPPPAPTPAAVPPKPVDVPAAKAPAAPPAPVTEEHEIFPPPSYAQRAAPVRQAPAARSAPGPGPRTLAAAAAVLVAAGFASYRYSRTGAGALQFPLARAADGVAYRADRAQFLVAEGPELVTLSRAGEVLERRPLEAPVGALRWDQGSLWSLDGRSPEIVEVRDGSHSTRFQLNHVPTSLFVKGTYVWTADRSAHTIHQYLISRSILGAILQPLDRIDLPGLEVATFAFDAAGDLWVVDAGRRSLYRLKSVGGVFKAVAYAPLSPLLGPTGGVRGLTLDDDALWLASNSDSGASLRRIPVSSLDWAPAE